jgi:hypothetical protein
MLYYVLTSPSYQVFCLATAILGAAMFGIHKAWIWAWNRIIKGNRHAQKSMLD